MLTIESIQDQLIEGYRNKKTKHVVEVTLNRDINENISAGLRIYKYENDEVTKMEHITFYGWERKYWKERLKMCLGIMNGVIDPFEEEENEDN